MSITGRRFSDSWRSSVSHGRRDTVTNPMRGAERFHVKAETFTRKDRANPHLIRSITYQERLNQVTSRLCLPTESSVLKNQVLHPCSQGHDLVTLDPLTNMYKCDNHFHKALYDPKGKCRYPLRGQLLRERGRLPPPGPSQDSKDVNLKIFQFPERLMYRQQWITNQKHFREDFKSSSRHQ